MRMPIRSWKNTLSKLGLKLVEKKPPRQRKKLRSHQIESLEAKQLLVADLFESEDNDTISTADVASPTAGTEYLIEGYLGDGSYSNDVDLYQFTLAAGQSIEADLDGYHLDDGSYPSSAPYTYLRLFDSGGTEVDTASMWTDADPDSGYTDDPVLDYNSALGGTYYLGVSDEYDDSYDPTTADSGYAGFYAGDYELQVNLTSVTPSPEITVEDANNVVLVDGTSTFDFSSTSTGNSVSHTFEVRNDGTADLTLGTPTVPTGFTLTSGPGLTTLISGASTTFTVQLDAATVGSYSGTVSFTNNDADEGPFDFTVSGTVTAPVDLNESEDNDTISTADVASPTAGTEYVIEGYLGDGSYSNDVDLYQFTLSAGQSIEADLDAYHLDDGSYPSSAPYTNLRLFDSGGIEVDTSYMWTDSDPDSGYTDDPVLDYTSVLGGTYYLGVSDEYDNYYDPTTADSGYAGYNPGGYELQVNLTSVTPTPEITVEDANDVVLVDGISTFDFSSTSIGISVSHTFEVRNDGTADLTLGTPTVPTGFTLTSGPGLTTLISGASTTFTVQLDAATAGAYSGDVSFTNNDANESPFDFTVSGTVTTPSPEIDVLESSVTITDGIDTVDYGSVQHLGSAVSKTFVIENNGTAELTLDVNSLMLPTGYTLVTPFDATVAVGTSTSFTVQLETATAGTQSGTISFTNNDSDEADFDFQVTGAVAGPPVSVSALTSSVAEDGGINGQFELTLASSLAEDLTVYYSMSGSAGNGYDYDYLTGSAVLLAGTTSVLIDVVLVDDVNVESAEDIVLTIDAAEAYSLGSPVSATISLTDDDLVDPEVNIAVTTAVGTEDGTTNAQFTVSLSGVTSSQLEVDFAITGDAQHIYDYEILVGQAIIPAGASSVVIDIKAIDDVNIEETEDVIITLEAGTGYVLGTADDGTITITDNDLVDPELSIFTVIQYAYETELESGLIQIDLPGITSEPIEVFYSVGGTATLEDDYYEMEGTVTIDAGETSAWVIVLPVLDAATESAETVDVTLLASADYTVPTTANAVITIEDDKPVFSVDLGSSFTINEGGSFSQNGSFSDAGNATTWTGTVDYDDGTGPQSLTLNGDGSFTLSNTYELDGVYNVWVEIVSEDQRIAFQILEVTATNVVPLIDLGADVTIGVGNDFSVLGSFVDPGSDTWTGTVDYGDGSEVQELSFLSGNLIDLNHVYDIAGAYVITVTIDDEGGTLATDTLNITVQYAPVIDLDADDSSGAIDSDFSVTFAEDGPGVAIADSDATLVDSDSTHITSLEATITNRWDGDDELLSVDVSGTSLIASYVDGTLAITGSETLAVYEQVLRTVQYQNIADDPYAEDRVVEITATDGSAVSLTATTTIAIQYVNDVPEAASRSVDVGVDYQTQLILGNDGDVEVAQNLQLVVLTEPTNGVLYGFDATIGTVWYQPDFDYAGADSFTYQLIETDTGELYSSPTATVSLTVMPANESPLVDDQAVTVSEDGVQSITLTGSDGELVASQTLAFTITQQPANGTLTNFDAAAGTVDYTPNAGYAGQDTFAFEITDDATVGWEARTSELGTVTVTVTGDNDAPVSNSQLIGVPEDIAVTVLLGNDGDEELIESMTMQVTVVPLHGTLTGFDAVTGEVIYTPEVGYLGTDTFSYTLTDDTGLGQVSSVAVIDLEVGTLPTADAAAVTMLEDASLAITLTGDDGDINNVNTLQYAITQTPSNGEILDFDSALGTFTYQPAVNFNGSDTIEFTVSYTTGAGAVITSSASVISITVDAVNDTPTSQTFQAVVAKETVTTIPLGEDADPELIQTLTLNIITAPANGTVTGFDPLTGNIDYTPNVGFSGTDSFTFTLTDDDTAGDTIDLTSDEGNITLYVRALPTVTGQALTITEDQTEPVTLSAQAGESGVLEYEISVYPEHGYIVDFDATTGDLTYIPEADYSGTDSFQFTVTEVIDGDEFFALESLPGTVSFTLTAENDTPVGIAQEVVMGQDQVMQIALLGDDQDPELEQIITYAIATQPANGVITDFDQALGTLTYTPNAGFFGTDSFTFTVTDDSTAGGTATTSTPVTVDFTVGANPVATAQAVATTEETGTAITLSASAGDLLLTPSFVYSIATLPEHGEVTNFDPLLGTLTYMPDPNFAGSDTLSFVVVDQLAGPNLMLLSDSVDVSITVTGVDDDPIAVSRAMTTREEFSVLMNLGTDGDDEVTELLTLNLVTAPTDGVLSEFDATTGYAKYLPNPGFVGVDSFTYTLTDATGLSSNVVISTVTVESVNHAPVASVGSVSTTEDQSIAFTLTGDDGDASEVQAFTFEMINQPKHGQITNFDPLLGTGTYVPDAGFNGADEFDFVVIEDDTEDKPGLASDPKTYSFTVSAVNNAPIAESRSIEMVEDQFISLILQGEDGDQEVEQQLTYVIVTQPSSGTISNFDALTGEFTYTPDANYDGIDSFTYQVTDDTTAGGAALDSALATIDFMINSIDFAALAVPQSLSTEKDQAVVIYLTGQGNPDTVQDLTYAIGTNPTDGVLSGLNTATGEVTYTPDSGYSGVDSFTFTVLDNNSTDAATTATVLVNTKASTTTIMANDDSVTVRASDGDILLDVLENDLIAASGTMTITAVTAPTTGAAAITTDANGDQVIQFTPAAGQLGSDSFTYTVSDGLGNTSTETVNVNVAADGVQASDGNLSLGGVGFDSQKESTFTPPVSGNYNASRSENSAFTNSWTDPAGNDYTGTGTQTNTVVTSLSELPNGDWVYSETVYWTYDVVAGNTHNWGGYNYTFIANSYAGSQFFALILNSNDQYSTSLDDSGGDAQDGFDKTGNASGGETSMLFMTKTSSALGGIAVSRNIVNSNSSHSGSSDYWSNSTDKSTTGTSTVSGSTTDFFMMNVTSLEAAGAWTSIGTSMGFGSGGDSQGFEESGTYTNDIIDGTHDASGDQSSNYNYSMSGTLQADLTWSLDGSGDIKEKGSTNSTYSGSGAYTTETEDTNSSSEISGTAEENGTSFNKTNKNLSIDLGAAGWDLDGGTDSYSGGSQSYYGKKGNGSYGTTHDDSGDGVSWNVNGSLVENSTAFSKQEQGGESTYTGGDWISTGSGVTINKSNTFSSYDGNGNYSQDLYDTDKTVSGNNSGHRTESGKSTKSDESTQYSNLDPTGEWISTGTASAKSLNDSFSDYEANGTYNYNQITRTSHVDGANTTSNESSPEYTLDSFGSWILTGGTSDQTSKSFSKGNYTGDGTYTETNSGSDSGEYEASGQGEQTSRTTITRHDEGNTSNKTSKTIHSIVVDNEWELTTGTATASGDTMTSSSNTNEGTYTSRQDNFVITGTATGNSNNNSSNKYDTTSTWNPSASVEGQTEPGGWILTGTASGNSNDLTHSEGTGTATYHQKVSTGRHDSTLDGTVNEDSFSHIFNNRDWASKLDATVGTDSSGGVGEESWELTSGDATSNEETKNNFTISATGTYIQNPPNSVAGYYSGTLQGDNSITIERHDTNKWDSKSTVNTTSQDWDLTSGSGTATRKTLNESGQSGSGNFTLETDDGNYTGTRFTDTFSHDSFNYETESNVTPATKTEAASWSTTSQSGDSKESGHNILSKSTSSKKYSESVDSGTGSISGQFHDTENTESNYEFNGDYNLDFSEPEFPDGQWKLTGGTGESFYGEGTGQSYALNGTYESKGSTKVFGEESQSWTVNGVIKENGFQNTTGGETTHYNVADNNWNETSSVPTLEISAGEDYSNIASGTYTRGGIDGSMDRSFVTESTSDRTIEDGGSGTTGSGTNFYLETTKDSYEYSGTYTEDDGHNITIKESGTTNNKYEENEEYELDSNDNFFQTSGTRTQNDSHEESAERTSKANWVEDEDTDDNRVTDPDGSWRSRIGTDSFTGKESRSSSYDRKEVYYSTTKQYDVTEQTSISIEESLLTTKHDTKGSYHDILPDGTATGTYKASGDSEHKFNAESEDTLVFGIIPVSSGKGKATGNSEANYEYTDKGSFKQGTISGTTSHSGKSHAESEYTKKLKYKTDGWYAKGTGESSASGESHSTYTGTGKLKHDIDGEKLKGTHTASGKHNESYDGDAKFSVGPAGWVLTSGTSESSYDGEEKYSKDLSGKYKVQFGPNSEAKLKGTVNLDTNFEMDYSGSYDATVVQNQWAATGEGDSTTTTSYDLDYKGSGRNLKTTPYDEGEPGVTGHDNYHVYSSESGENHIDTVYKYDWELTAAGESTDTHLEVKSSAEGKYTYRLKEALKRKTVDGDYDAGNGSISIVKESSKGVAKEKFKWDQTVNVYEDTDTKGNITIWGNTTGKSEGNGKSTDKFKDHEYFRSKFTSPGLATSGVSNSGGSGNGEDFYKYTGKWNETISKTSAKQFSVNYNNKVNGESTRNTYVSATATSTVYTQDSAGVTISKTETDSDSVTDPSIDTSYSTTNSGNSFYSQNNNTWTQSGGFGTWAVMAPHTGDSTTSTPATTNTTPNNSTSPTSNTNPLAGGPWFKAGTFTTISVLTDNANMMTAGAATPTGFESVRDNSVAIEMPEIPSPYSNGFNRFLGENIIRPVIGDEALANATDFELFVYTAGAVTVIVAGAAFAPVLTLVGAGFGAGMGAGIGAAYNVAAQLEAGVAWEDIDASQVGKAAYAGALKGALMGGAMGLGGAVIPGFCAVTTVMAGVSGVSSSASAYNNFQDGNYYTGSLDVAMAALSFMAVAKGNCFVQGTTVVAYVSSRPLVADGSSTEENDKTTAQLNALATFSLLAGSVGLMLSPDKRKKKTEFETASERFFSEHWDWDEPIEKEPEIDLDLSEDDWNNQTIDQTWATEKDWGLNHFSDHHEPAPGNLATLDTPTVRKKTRPIAYQPKPKTVAFELPSAKEEAAPTKNKTIFWASLALMLLGPVLVLASLFSSTPPPLEQPLLPPVVQQQNVPIEELRIGDWVVADNPELSEAEHLQGLASIDPSSMRVVSLELLKDDDSLLRVKLLRGINWIEENSISDGWLLDVELPELGASGMAYVHSVEPCPDIIAQPAEDARLVTATFVHEAATALNLQIVDANGIELEKIGVTGSHPMWSETRQDFIPVEELTIGEELLSAFGNPIFVGSIESRAGPETVYNIEVDTEHVYYVTSTGVLAHNSCYGKRKNGQWKAKPGPKVKGLLNRPGLRLSFKNSFNKGIAKKFFNNNGSLKKEYHFGHKKGWENRRLLSAAKKLKMNQRQLNEYVNKRPQHFKIELAKKNLSHKYEKPGIGGLDKILIDMKSFLITGN